MAISLQADPAAPRGYILVDGVPAATVSTQGLSANNLFNYVDTEIGRRSSTYESIIACRFNHLTNSSSVIAQGVAPVQTGGFFPDNRGAGVPSFRVSNGAPGIAKHWITITFTPQRANRIVGEVNFPLRVAGYTGSNEDESCIYIFDVTTGTPTIVTQQALFNGTVPSTGGQMHVPFQMNVTPGVQYRLLVTAMNGHQGTRNDTDIIPSYVGYQMNITSITGNFYYVSDSDARFLTLTSGRFANCEVFVNGFYQAP